MCNCKLAEAILGVIILIFAFVNHLAARWIVAIAAIVLIIHSFSCKNLAMCASGAAMPAKPAKAASKKK